MLCFIYGAEQGTEHGLGSSLQGELMLLRKSWELEKKRMLEVWGRVESKIPIIDYISGNFSLHFISSS